MWSPPHGFSSFCTVNIFVRDAVLSSGATAARWALLTPETVCRAGLSSQKPGSSISTPGGTGIVGGVLLHLPGLPWREHIPPGTSGGVSPLLETQHTSVPAHAAHKEASPPGSRHPGSQLKRARAVPGLLTLSCGTARTLMPHDPASPGHADGGSESPCDSRASDPWLSHT